MIYTILKFLKNFFLIFVLYTVVIISTFKLFIPVNTSFIKNNLFDFSFVPKISPLSKNIRLKAAIIASEDQKFFQHYGFDVHQIKKVISNNKKRIRGASTITQQLSKNLFLTKSKTYIRKLIEAYYTVLLEILIPKNRILELYISVVQTGDNIYGFQNASMKYFNKKIQNLDDNEISFLVALLPNPKRYFKLRKYRFFIKRKNRIKKMIDDIIVINEDYLKESL